MAKRSSPQHESFLVEQMAQSLLRSRRIQNEANPAAHRPRNTIPAPNPPAPPVQNEPNLPLRLRRRRHISQNEPNFGACSQLVTRYSERMGSRTSSP